MTLRVLLIILAVLAIHVNSVSARKRAVQTVSTQGNHTTEDNNKTKVYTLKQLRQDKPLAIVLKTRSDQESNILQELPGAVNVTISDSKGHKVECRLTRLNNMCYMDSVQEPNNTSVKLSCQKQPCQYLFEAYQSDLYNAKDVKQNDTLRAIYNVDSNDSLVTVVCSDTTVQSLVKEIKLISNTKYSVIDQGPIVYYIFHGKVDRILILASDKVTKNSQIRFSTDVSELQITDDINKTQRTFIEKNKLLKINKLPTKELRMDTVITQVNGNPLKPVNITFYGYKGTQKQPIDSFIIKDQSLDGVIDSSLDVNIIVKATDLKNYKEIAVGVSTEQDLFMLCHLEDVEKHEIDVEEQSYFALDKDQKLEFKIRGDDKANKDDTITINLKENSNISHTLSQNPCFYSKGCTLSIVAKENTSTVLSATLSKIKVKDVKYIELKNQLSMTLNQGEIRYLIHNSTQTMSKMIRVSSPNVIVYAAGEKCPIPSAKCFQFSGNIQRVMSIQNTTGPLYISVEGLELVRFTIFISQGNNILELSDGIPMPINMQKDKQIYLRFKIQKKQTVNFNLIAPLNTFVMYVSNSEELPDGQDMDIASSSSFLKINEDQVDKLIFTILIKRVIERENQHFTIIASTSHATIVLDKAEPHYDLLQADEYRSFVLLVSPKDIDNKVQSILSLSIFQKIQGKVDITVTISGPSDAESKKVSVNKRDSTIDINPYAEKICDQQDDENQCQVYIKLQNNNEERLDITLTVLVNNAIIELRTGIWQRFEMTSVTSSSHFFFYPKNKKYPVTIQFSHSYSVYKLAYTLWNNELEQKNAAEWPFPSSQSHLIPAQGAHTSEYIINPDEIAKCFPNCIVLISLFNSNEAPNTDPNVVAPIFRNFGAYSIMATDSMTEMQQQHKITVSIAPNETRYLLVSLTPYVKTNKTITFLCSDIVGYHVLTASLSSNKNVNLPTDDTYDYRFDMYEFQITMDNISSILRTKDMENHEQIDLIIMAKGISANKFVFEYTTKDENLQKLSLGVPHTAILEPNSSRSYLIDYFSLFRVKAIRRKGFPYIVFKPCQRNRMSQCIEDLKSATPVQITSKADEFRQSNCPFCVLIIRIISKNDPVEVDLVALSDFAAIQLSQGKVHTDFAVINQTNEYKISVVKGSDIVISVTVFEGQPTVTAYNIYQNINITGKRTGNLIRVVLNSALFNQKNNTNAVVNQNYALSSTFSQITIAVQDKKMNCSYTISYTIGERHLDLLDGVLHSQQLKNNQNVTYNYHNWQNSTAIVSISFSNTEMLEECKVKILSYRNNDGPVETKPNKLEIHKKTPKPSITFSLNETFTDFELVLTNKGQKELSFNLTISHVDIILLPFDYEYPASLAASETSYFLVEVFNDGYIYFNVKKCSDNDLSFAYSLDDASFEKEEFAFSTMIFESSFSSSVHVKASTLYLKLSSQEGMLYSIKASWYPAKKDVPKQDIKPGNKGMITYDFDGKGSVTVSFTPIVCNSSHCPKAEYFYVESADRVEATSQAQCPSSFFLYTSIKSLTPQKVKTTQGINNTLTFTIPVQKELMYLGLKAILEDGRQITYEVIEVATLWGSLQKNKHYHIGILVLSLFSCCFCLVMRRRDEVRYRKGRYSHLNEQDQ